LNKGKIIIITAIYTINNVETKKT